jgi:Rrf2 family cysteine metabolism transcriptional repressor
MKLSTRGRYGLRMLADLALQAKKPVSLQSIAGRQDVSVNYLEQLAKSLKKAGYIRSVKGPQGGYMLSKDPKEMTAGDILRTLEGDLLLIENPQAEETLIRQCLRDKVYDPLKRTLSEFFDSITLHDIITEKKLV